MAPKAAAESGPSHHFSWAEFACKDYLHAPYPLDWRVDRAVPLAMELERLRALLSHWLQRDVPLYLDSVFRTAAHNKAVGGKRLSQHLEGRAADVRCPHGCTSKMFREAILAVAEEPDSRIRYVKFYPHQGFAHLDIRPTAKLSIEEATP
jgi:uncharacterized protein YcbK (DUF882 family)